MKEIPPDQSRGWLRVAGIPSSNGCPPGLEEVPAQDKKLCRKTVDTGCSSVTFPTNGISYSKVCGLVYGYHIGTSDGLGDTHTVQTVTLTSSMWTV